MARNSGQLLVLARDDGSHGEEPIVILVLLVECDHEVGGEGHRVIQEGDGGKMSSARERVDGHRTDRQSRSPSRPQPRVETSGPIRRERQHLLEIVTALGEGGGALLPPGAVLPEVAASLASSRQHQRQGHQGRRGDAQRTVDACDRRPQPLETDRREQNREQMRAADQAMQVSVGGRAQEAVEDSPGLSPEEEGEPERASRQDEGAAGRSILGPGECGRQARPTGAHRSKAQDHARRSEQRQYGKRGKAAEVEQVAPHQLRQDRPLSDRVPLPGVLPATVIQPGSVTQQRRGSGRR